jgi:hypothetical protein
MLRVKLALFDEIRLFRGRLLLRTALAAASGERTVKSVARSSGRRKMEAVVAGKNPLHAAAVPVSNLVDGMSQQESGGMPGRGQLMFGPLVSRRPFIGVL